MFRGAEPKANDNVQQRRVLVNSMSILPACRVGCALLRGGWPLSKLSRDRFTYSTYSICRGGAALLKHQYQGRAPFVIVAAEKWYSLGRSSGIAQPCLARKVWRAVLKCGHMNSCVT